LIYEENAKILYIEKTFREKKLISFKLFFVSYKYRINVFNYNKIQRVFSNYLLR